MTAALVAEQLTTVEKSGLVLAVICGLYIPFEIRAWSRRKDQR